MSFNTCLGVVYQSVSPGTHPTKSGVVSVPPCWTNVINWDVFEGHGDDMTPRRPQIGSVIQCSLRRKVVFSQLLQLRNLFVEVIV